MRSVIETVEKNRQLDDTQLTLRDLNLIGESFVATLRGTYKALWDEGIPVDFIEAASIPAGDPARKLLDVRNYKADGGAALHEKVRHELAMMPYISEFDFISFNLNGGDVILTGWTVRITNRSEAQNRIKGIEGITSIVNNIEVLPMGSFDMQIRAGARAAAEDHHIATGLAQQSRDLNADETGTTGARTFGGPVPSPAGLEITRELLERVRPHQVYAAGDLSDPHGTHRVCLAVVLAALAEFDGLIPDELVDYLGLGHTGRG